MPRQDRLHTAVAAVDVQLAEWAAAEGLAVSPGKVNRWRRAGLLPEPSQVGLRPSGSPSGRRPRGYTNDERDAAERAIRFLAAHARRGRSLGELALLMFAADLPVAEEAVLGGFRDQTERTQRLRELYVPHAETEPDPEFSEASSRALLAATRDVEANTDVVRMVRKLLKEAGRPTDDDELRMVLTALFGLLLGEPPEEHDVEALTALLEMIGGAGLMESIGEGVPPVLAGISDWHEVLTISTQDQSDVPADLSFSELVDARDLCVGLGTVFTAVPEDAAHYLGGRYIASLWQPENPQRIVQLLTWTVNARRANHIDEEPMFNAARAAGILPDS